MDQFVTPSMTYLLPGQVSTHHNIKFYKLNIVTGQVCMLIIIVMVTLRPEPIMLKILPIILSRISQKILLLFFLLFFYPAYYSIIILIQYNILYLWLVA